MEDKADTSDKLTAILAVLLSFLQISVVVGLLLPWQAVHMQSHVDGACAATASAKDPAPDISQSFRPMPRGREDDLDES